MMANVKKQNHLGETSSLSARVMRSVVRSSIGRGAGPTPALWHAEPQKGWSPKKGTMNVGLPRGIARVGGSFLQKIGILKVITRGAAAHLPADRQLWCLPRRGERRRSNAQTASRGAPGR